MTAINSVSTIPKWMVPPLFGSSDTSGSKAEKASLDAMSQLASDSSAAAKVSSGTAQAIVALKQGGFTMTESVEEAARLNEALRAANTMTSAKLNDAMYKKGILIPDPTSTAEKPKDDIYINLNIVDNPDNSSYDAADPTDPTLSDGASQDSQNTLGSWESLLAAFAHHTLTVQKFSDIPSLDYTDTRHVVALAFGPGTLGKVSYNKDALSDIYKNNATKGISSRSIVIGGVNMLATW